MRLVTILLLSPFYFMPGKMRYVLLYYILNGKKYNISTYILVSILKDIHIAPEYKNSVSLIPGNFLQNTRINKG